MTSSRNQDGEGKKSTGESAASVSQKRRRLIKGAAAAAPGIFTLYSGNAQAMLSTYQCTDHSHDAFSGEQEFAGEEHMVDSFVRLGQGEGIHVVWTHPKYPDKKKEKWLVMVMDNTGSSHYIEAGYLSEESSTYGGRYRRYSGKKWWHGDNTGSGITWNEVLTEVEWRPTDDSGLGSIDNPLKLTDPSSDHIYVQDFEEAKTIQVLACVDDSGNVVSAYPQDCEALGLSPPSGSCWASIGTESMSKWWG